MLYFTNKQCQKPWRPKDNITNAGAAGTTEEPHQRPWNQPSPSFFLHCPLVCPHILQLSKVSWRLASTFRSPDWVEPSEHTSSQSPHRHSDLSLPNSHLPRLLGKRGCWIGGQPHAHAEGGINSPLQTLVGAGLLGLCNALIYPLSFSFWKQTCLILPSSPIQESGALAGGSWEAVLSLSTWGFWVWRRISLLAARKKRRGRQSSKPSLGEPF